MSFDDNLCQWVFKPDPVSAFKSDPSWMEQSPQTSSLFGGSSPVGFACAALFFSAPFALCEAVGCISGLNDFAVLCDAIQKCVGHLGVPEDRDPFAELQVGCDAAPYGSSRLDW